MWIVPNFKWGVFKRNRGLVFENRRVKTGVSTSVRFLTGFAVGQCEGYSPKQHGGVFTEAGKNMRRDIIVGLISTCKNSFPLAGKCSLERALYSHYSLTSAFPGGHRQSCGWCWESVGAESSAVLACPSRSPQAPSRSQWGRAVWGKRNHRLHAGVTHFVLLSFIVPTELLSSLCTMCGARTSPRTNGTFPLILQLVTCLRGGFSIGTALPFFFSLDWRSILSFFHEG